MPALSGTAHSHLSSPYAKRKEFSFGRHLLSSLLSGGRGASLRLGRLDLKSIETDLKGALAALHARGLDLKGNIREAVLLEKEVRLPL